MRLLAELRQVLVRVFEGEPPPLHILGAIYVDLEVRVVRADEGGVELEFVRPYGGVVESGLLRAGDTLTYRHKYNIEMKKENGPCSQRQAG